MSSPALRPPVVLTPPKLRVFTTPAAAARAAAQQIATLILERRGRGEPCVLGLATGRTPIPLYEELARLHRDEGLSFAGVHSFNLDELWPAPPDAPESFRAFMERHLFRRVDLAAEQIHFLRGDVSAERIAEHCRGYEEELRGAGGLDLQLLGIGANGHIGFNEPGSAADSRTRLVTLAAETRRAQGGDAAAGRVPRQALTMGVATILEARRIVLLAFGQAKAEAVGRALGEPPSAALPASWLRLHPNVEFYLDEEAAACCTS